MLSERRVSATSPPKLAAPPDTAKAAVLQTILADLAAETDSLVTILARLATTDWDTPTPAEGWTIRDQVTHGGWGGEWMAGRCSGFRWGDVALGGGSG